MIGSRVPLAAATGLALVAGLGGGAPRPELDVAARASILERATVAETVLGDLRDRVAEVLDAARSGSARIVAGEANPGPMFERAADGALGAVDVALDALAARDRLASVLEARSPGGVPLPPAPDPADVGSVASQLEVTAEAAERFVVMRSRAESVTASLLDALEALEANDIEAAEALVAGAREAHDAVADWEVGTNTLPVWIATVDEMIGAMERLVDATRAGDAAAGREAANRFAALAADAPEADRALRIALGEGGTAVAANAMERLAALLTVTDDLRIAVVRARQAAGG